MKKKKTNGTKGGEEGETLQDKGTLKAFPRSLLMNCINDITKNIITQIAEIVREKYLNYYQIHSGQVDGGIGVNEKSLFQRAMLNSYPEIESLLKEYTVFTRLGRLIQKYYSGEL